MAFRNKADVIFAYNPDILIIPECENLEKLNLGLNTPQPSDRYWYGDLPSKGIGVFTFHDFKIKQLDIHNPEFKYVLPLSIHNEHITYTVFAVWAQNSKNHFNYTEHVWHALQYYQHLLEGENVLLAGDFNSNTIWDNHLGKINHTLIVEFLKEKKIVSTYHQSHDQIHGQEKDNTFNMYRKKEFKFHLDYCFASADLIDKLKDVQLGRYEYWTKFSDHLPMIIKFN